MIEYKFYQLSEKVHGSIAFLTWLPTSSYMSENDFIEHCNVVNNFINVDCTRILFIDATDFNMKMDRSFTKELQYIKEQDSMKWIFYTSSNKRMRRLIQKMEKEDIEVTKYSSRNALQRAYKGLICN